LLKLYILSRKLMGDLKEKSSAATLFLLVTAGFGRFGC